MPVSYAKAQGFSTSAPWGMLLLLLKSPSRVQTLQILQIIAHQASTVPDSPVHEH